MSEKITIRDVEYSVMPYPRSRPFWVKATLIPILSILCSILTTIFDKNQVVAIVSGVPLLVFVGLTYFRWPNPLGGRWLRKMEVDGNKELNRWVDMDRKIIYV